MWSSTNEGVRHARGVSCSGVPEDDTCRVYTSSTEPVAYNIQQDITGAGGVGSGMLQADQFVTVTEARPNICNRCRSSNQCGRIMSTVIVTADTNAVR